MSKPKSETELLDRAQSLAGICLQELAERYQVAMPRDLRRDKGWVGQLLEIALGADAKCKPVPDFTDLGIELKTLPITPEFKPLESTFVCSIPLLEVSQLTWEQSYCYQKLAHVLWIPIIVDQNKSLAERRIGTALLWRPNLEESAILRQDWQELTDMMALGQLEQITARHGIYLQIRPKAASGKSLCYGINAEGEKVLTLPRGFYLRARFTQRLLQTYYL